MSELHDKIVGLDNGADDYLVKPFHISELSARIRALARRPAIISEESRLQYHDLSLSLGRKELSCNENTIPLTPKEYLLMCAFLEKPDTILTREQLMQKVWETDAPIEQGIVFPFCKQYYVCLYDSIFPADTRKYRNHAGCRTQLCKQTGYKSHPAF